MSRTIDLWVVQRKGRKVPADIVGGIDGALHDIAGPVPGIVREGVQNAVAVPGKQVGFPVLVPEHAGVYRSGWDEAQDIRVDGFSGRAHRRYRSQNWL